MTIKSLRNNYDNNVKQLHTQCRIPAFQELPILYLPATTSEPDSDQNSFSSTMQDSNEVSYHIIDMPAAINEDAEMAPCTDLKSNLITIPFADLQESDSDVIYQPQLIEDQWCLYDLNSCFSINQYGPIYLILNKEQDRCAFFSLLQTSALNSYLHQNHPIYLYSSMDEFLIDLKESDLSLPQNIVCVNTVGRMEQITEQLIQTHNERIQSTSKKRPLLSICIPTYNRGSLALEKVNLLQQLIYNNEIEFIISDNGSTKGQEEYAKIQAMAATDNRICYHHFDTNQQFLGNFWKVLQLAHAPHALLISDEDYVVTDALPHYLGLLLKYPEVGAIRSSGNCFYLPQQMENGHFQAGATALQQFFLRNNYLSGIIYRAEAIPASLPAQYDQQFATNEAFIHYPHEFVDMYLCNHYDFISDKTVLFLCGEPEVYDEYKESSGQMIYQTRRSRMLQLDGFIDLINEMTGIDDLTRLNLYAAACKKYLFLLHLNQLKEEGWDQIVAEYQTHCRTGFDVLNLQYKSMISEPEVDALIEELSVL